MSDSSNGDASNKEMLRMVTDIVSAYVGHNTVSSHELPELIKTVHRSLCGIKIPDERPREPSLKPAVPVKRSIQPDHLICLEDGKKLKMLKRYLRTKYDMTPDQYRAKWGLPSDYPMVAPNYSSQRSRFAKQIGLGRRRDA